MNISGMKIERGKKTGRIEQGNTVIMQSFICGPDATARRSMGPETLGAKVSGLRGLGLGENWGLSIDILLLIL